MEKYVVSSTTAENMATGHAEQVWYAHMEGFNYCPIFGSIGSKEHAQAYANMYNHKKFNRAEVTQ